MFMDGNELTETNATDSDLATLRTEFAELSEAMDDKIIAAQTMHLLTESEGTLLRQAGRLLKTLPARLDNKPNSDQTDQAFAIGRSCDHCINNALSLQGAHLSITLAVVLGFMDRFHEYATDRCGFYLGALTAAFKKKYVAEVMETLRFNSIKELTEIVTQGKQIVRNAIFETLYSKGKIALSGEEEVHLLTFLLDCPAQISYSDQELTRAYEVVLAPCQAPAVSLNSTM